MNTGIITTVTLAIVSVSAQAADLFSFPQLKMRESKYNEAANKAVKAAMVQSGFQDKVDQFQSVVSKKVETTASYAINEYTPFRHKDIYFLLGTTYAIGVRKEISKSFKNPLFPSVTNTVQYSGKDKKSALMWEIKF